MKFDILLMWMVSWDAAAAEANHQAVHCEVPLHGALSVKLIRLRKGCTLGRAMQCNACMLSAQLAVCCVLCETCHATAPPLCMVSVECS
jgi:hypothetical protein